MRDAFYFPKILNARAILTMWHFDACAILWEGYFIENGRQFPVGIILIGILTSLYFCFLRSYLILKLQHWLEVTSSVECETCQNEVLYTMQLKLQIEIKGFRALISPDLILCQPTSPMRW